MFRKKEKKKNLWNLKSLVIGRDNFGESLDVFMEQPVWREEKKKTFTDLVVIFVFEWLFMKDVIHTSHRYLKARIV